MSGLVPWVSDANAVLLTDLYELRMLQAYWAEEMRERASFSLYFRELPERRNFVLACGLEDVLRYLENLRFRQPELDWLRTLEGFHGEFVDWLGALRFTGDVHAVPEGTPVFPEVPLLEIVAPIAEAQLAESFVMNQMHLQSVAASKAARVVAAAAGRAVIDFGMRRTHGADAALKGARAQYLAGVSATSNVLAGRVYGIPVAGTMAHSYVQAHDREFDALRSFARSYPETILLVDTYDTLDGVRRVVDLSRELGDAFRVSGVRIDSGDLRALSFAARRLLDEAGLEQVAIFASGGLDEDAVDALVRAGAPIAGFGVGTRMGASTDAPTLDLAYKLTAYAGQGRLKTSPGKRVLPGRKQVFRQEEAGRAVRDVLARADETLPGRPLLRPVMRNGRRLDAGREDLEAARERAAREIARLPDSVRALEPARPPYPVETSQALRQHYEEVAGRTSS